MGVFYGCREILEDYEFCTQAGIPAGLRGKNIIIQAVPNHEIYKEIHELLVNNRVEIPIAKTFNINEFKDAYRFAKNRGVVGKVIFTIQ